MIMTGQDRAEASAALMSWCESQGMSVPEAGSVLALTIGIIIGEAATTTDGIADAMEAFIDDAARYALMHFENKQAK